MTTRQPVAYIRRSKVEAGSPGDVSRDTQLAAIRARAGIDGHNGDMVILEDWGKSGRRSKVDKREGYARLREMVEQGTVSTIYAYNWSRLGRSTRDLLELADQCKAQGTAIVTATGQSVDPTTADGRMLLTILTAVDEWQAEVQAERTTGVLAAWREAHPDERLGRKPYGDHDGEDREAVFVAFQEAGSFLGAAKLLNERGVPTRVPKCPTGCEKDHRHHAGWSVRTVARIIRDEKRGRPELVPMGERRGMPSRGRHLFSGLLTCACGDTLTSMPSAWAVRYYCRRAHADAQHARPYVVSERRLLPLVMAEAEHMILPASVSEEDMSAERARLAEERQNVGLWALRGHLPPEAVQAELDSLDARIAELDALSRVVDVPEVVKWDGPVDKVNEALRAWLERIDLGPDMLPVRYVWRLPDLRAD